MESKEIELNSIIKRKEVPDNLQHPTIDIVKSIESGEFDPFILALVHDYISIDFLTLDGYNIMHQATAFNAKEIIYLLVEKLNVPIDILSQTKQTPLMIAANLGFIELMKYFLDHGSNISLNDECNFSALLYSLKQGEITSVIYLLHRGSDVLIKDNNGCGLVHWAAYKNNLFFLRLFKRLGLHLNDMDFHGFKPIDRAIANSGFESVKFLLENVPEDINLATVNFSEIQNEEIKNYMIDKVQEGNRLRDRIKKKLEYYRKNIVMVGYVLWMLFMIGNFTNDEKSSGHFYSLIVIFGLWVYLICYICVFLQKEKIEESNDEKNRDLEYFKEDDAFLDFLNMNSLSFSHLDHLINHENFIASNQYTILHYIAFLIDSSQFLKVLEIDYKRVCPTCLIYKQPKTKHCSFCNKCVSYYHHHSLIFNRCFNYKNHIFYLGLLILQEILISLFLKIMISSYYDDCKSWVFVIPEVVYILIKDRGLIWGLNLIVNFAFWCYNSGFLAIEIYGIVNNLSFNEIMNRQRYRYLFKKCKNNKGKITYVYANCTSKSFILNTKNYIRRCFL